MSDTKNAILFYLKDLVPLTFTEYKIYDLGTGYVALFDNENNKPVCVLCRILDDEEILSFDKKAINTLVLKSSEGVKEVTALIISKSFKSIEEADNVINSYKSAFN